MLRISSKVFLLPPILFAFLPLAFCQLDLHYSQFDQKLELSCSLDNLTGTSISFLDSLVIHKSTNNGDLVLASVSAHYGQNNSVSHVPDAHVSGMISTDGSNQRYLNILWDFSLSELNGDYTCTAYGVDADYIPKQLSQTLTVSVKATGPMLFATPETIRLGLTDLLEVTCSVPDPGKLNVSKMATLDIRRVHNGVEQLLATVNAQSSATLHVGNNGAMVNGSMDKDDTFLQLSWRNPTEDLAGQYICEGSGVSSNFIPVFFNRHINVTWEEPDRQDLVQRLFEMYKEKKEDDKTIAKTQEQLQKALETVQHLNKSQCPHTCDDIRIQTPGFHKITVTPDDGLGTIDVLCEVESPGIAWTVFQRRFNGSVDFYRDFDTYKNGFGSLDGEFWLGLENMRRLILQNGDQNQLRVDMTERGTGVNHTRIYPVFSIGPGDDYTLTTTGFNDGGQGMSYNSGSEFSTFDHGKTTIASKDFRAAGWWFSDSGYVNLNGLWGVVGKQNSIFWYEFHADLNKVLEATVMKFRRN